MFVFFTVMSAMMGSISTCKFRNYKVSSGKPLFVRERLNKTYDVGPYYFSKLVTEFPLQVIIPTVVTIIPYFIIGLNTSSPDKYPILC